MTNMADIGCIDTNILTLLVGLIDGEGTCINLKHAQMREYRYL